MTVHYLLSDPSESFMLDGYQVFPFHATPGFDPRRLQGQIVQFSGKRWLVRRIETSAIMDPTGASFSLQVEPAPEPEQEPSDGRVRGVPSVNPATYTKAEQEP